MQLKYNYLFPRTLYNIQHVSLGSSTKLEVLKFAEGSFSFHWTKEGSRRQIKTTDEPNTVTFQSVYEEDFGHSRTEHLLFKLLSQLTCQLRNCRIMKLQKTRCHTTFT